MQRINVHADPIPEVVVRVTWRQWEDGHWEAWLVEDAGRSALVRSRAELVRFLEACTGGGLQGR